MSIHGAGRAFWTAAAAILILSGCTKTETVYVETPPWENPSDQAGEFMGYNNSSVKSTVCGNCHVGQSSRWAETAHSNAWASIAGKQEFCQNCHATGPLGNDATQGGWAATMDARYHDVQCEACHGPGQQHVSIPDNPATAPNASIAVIQDSMLVGCAQCHNGSHHPFVNEWAESRHSNVFPRDGCQQCHTGQGALQAWGITARYKEDGDALADHQAITCSVCHDPHSPEIAGQLRFPIDAPNQQQNLCIKCHHKRGVPETDADTFRGPHSPEGPLLLGEAGWWPPGFNTGIQTTHGPMGNPRMCATCHVVTTQIEDPDAVIVKSTGHLFKAIPCADSTGVPNTDDCDLPERLYDACVTCHQTPELTQQTLTRARDRTNLQIAELDSLLDNHVPPGDLDMSSGVFTVAKGAWFNARLAEFTGSPTHNGTMIDELMKASIAAVKDAYNIPGANLDAVREEHQRKWGVPPKRRFLSEEE